MPYCLKCTAETDWISLTNVILKIKKEHNPKLFWNLIDPQYSKDITFNSLLISDSFPSLYHQPCNLYCLLSHLLSLHQFICFLNQPLKVHSIITFILELRRLRNREKVNYPRPHSQYVTRSGTLIQIYLIPYSLFLTLLVMFPSYLRQAAIAKASLPIILSFKIMEGNCLYYPCNTLPYTKRFITMSISNHFKI